MQHSTKWGMCTWNEFGSCNEMLAPLAYPLNLFWRFLQSSTAALGGMGEEWGETCCAGGHFSLQATT